MPQTLETRLVAELTEDFKTKTPQQFCNEMSDETIIGLAQTCRVSMERNGKLLQSFNRVQHLDPEHDDYIPGPNPFVEPYNAAVKCYESIKELMAERGINPANP